MSTFNKNRDDDWQEVIDALGKSPAEDPGFEAIVSLLERTPLSFRPALLAEMIRIASPAFRMPDGIISFVGKSIARVDQGGRRSAR